MNQEIRIMYIVMIIGLFSFAAGHISLSRQLGVAEGKLEVLEEFKHLYMPNPANVYPDAVDTLKVGR
jgi:hypothetical protein